MSESSKEIFKQQIIYSKKQNKKLKTKKLPKWIVPTAYYRQLKKIIKIIMQKYIDITLSIYPKLEQWKNNIKRISDFDSEYIKQLKQYQNDSWEEELNEIDENEFQKEFDNNKEWLKRTLLSTAFLISAFNKKQWQKQVNTQFGFETFTYESWEKTLLQAWVNRNVSLIKGLTDEYRKKIIDTVINSYNKGTTIEELKSNLKKINNTFSEYRTELIAKDQTNKINNQLSEQRLKDAGIETYYWRNSQDERVVGNPSGIYPNPTSGHGNHWIMEGLLCRIDDPTVYSDDNGETWKKRTSEMPKGRPGEEYNCRCFEEPNFNPLVNELNSTQENLLG